MLAFFPRKSNSKFYVVCKNISNTYLLRWPYSTRWIYGLLHNSLPYRTVLGIRRPDRDLTSCQICLKIVNPPPPWSHSSWPHHRIGNISDIPVWSMSTSKLSLLDLATSAMPYIPKQLKEHVIVMSSLLSVHNHWTLSSHTASACSCFVPKQHDMSQDHLRATYFQGPFEVLRPQDPSQCTYIGHGCHT